MTNKTAKAELRRLRDEVITSESPFYGGKNRCFKTTEIPNTTLCCTLRMLYTFKKIYLFILIKQPLLFLNLSEFIHSVISIMAAAADSCRARNNKNKHLKCEKGYLYFLVKSPKETLQ